MHQALCKASGRAGRRSSRVGGSFWHARSAIDVSFIMTLCRYCSTVTQEGNKQGPLVRCFGKSFAGASCQILLLRGGYIDKAKKK